MLDRRLNILLHLLLPLLFVFLLPSLAFVDFSGRVVGVADGDTITVLKDKTPVKVRLNGIDAPEKKQAFGARAKQFTSKSAFGKVVTIRERGRDKYGRTVADVILPGGAVLNRELVKAGLAWHYVKYAPRDEALRELEWEARLEKRGLWADKDPVPPWCYRKQQKGREC